MAKQIQYEMLRGFAYRNVKHPEIHVYTVILPLILGAIFITAYVAIPIRPHLLGEGGLISSGMSLLSTLPGFYFAGLAAVATLGGADLDKEMPQPTPSIEIMVRGKMVIVNLTRRQFVSYLFSYLVVISFLLCIVCVALQFSTPSLSAFNAYVVDLKLGNQIWLLGKIATVSMLSLLLATMLVTTLHGIFFLTEKIHQP